MNCRNRLSRVGVVVALASVGCSDAAISPPDSVEAGTRDAPGGMDSRGTPDGQRPGDDGGVAPPDATASSASDAQAEASTVRVAGPCRPKFASGVNAAWIRFGADVPNPDLAAFTTLFQNTRAAGGRVVRWWLHVNGSVTPGYDPNAMPAKLSAQTIADVRSILEVAHSVGVAVNISLWSFDMLQASEGPPLANNLALLTQDANRQAYIDNALTPLVTALKGHPGLYSWEIFNEPEGMTTQNGWTPTKVDEKVVQVCVNWFADAIHRADPSALVTNGAWTFIANSNVGTYRNAYSDANLRAAGGRAKGTLDFYEVHYYDNWGSRDSTVVSPFKHPLSYWSVDKPVVIGEFWAIDTNGVKAADLYTTLYNNAYAGAWAWQYTNVDNPGPDASTTWPTMKLPMDNLYSAHKADLDCP